MSMLNQAWRLYKDLYGKLPSESEEDTSGIVEELENKLQKAFDRDGWRGMDELRIGLLKENRGDNNA